jgi:hypothetical protein
MKNGDDILKHTNSMGMHGYYQMRYRFRIDIEMAVKGTSFEAMTPDNINTK